MTEGCHHLAWIKSTPFSSTPVAVASHLEEKNELRMEGAEESQEACSLPASPQSGMGTGLWVAWGQDNNHYRDNSGHKASRSRSVGPVTSMRVQHPSLLILPSSHVVIHMG